MKKIVLYGAGKVANYIYRYGTEVGSIVAVIQTHKDSDTWNQIKVYNVEILKELGLKHRPTLMNDYIKPALALGLIEMTQPDSPKSPTQKYKVRGK